MDEFAHIHGAVVSLAGLRTNALLAMKTSGERAVTVADVEHLDAIIVEAFGEPSSWEEFVPGWSLPQPGGPVLQALKERLPEAKADGAEKFLIDLHGRIHRWFND